MKLLFLSAADLEEAEYIEGSLGPMLQTRYGSADTVGFCGRVESVSEAELTITDRGEIRVCSAPGLVSRLRKNSYVLVYGKPTVRDGLCVNVSRDDGLIEVGEETFRRFHKIREKASKYLLENPAEETAEEGFVASSDDEDIIEFIEKNDTGNGVEIDRILERFKKVENVGDRLLELMEAGELYEPKAGRFKALR